MATAPTAPVSSVMHEPGWYRGKTVRLAGEVEQVHDPRAFTMEGDETWWEHDITVITKTPVELAGIPLDDDDDVMVTGRIAVGTAEVERELGRTLEPEVARTIGNRPVLIARSIRLVDEYATWVEDSRLPSIGMLTLLAAPDPERLVGERVVISTEVRSVGTRAIWIGSRRAKQVLVVPSDPAILGDLRPGITVSITGTAKAMPPVVEAMRVFDLDPAAKRDVGEARLYVEASRIEPVSRPTAMR